MAYKIMENFILGQQQNIIYKSQILHDIMIYGCIRIVQTPREHSIATLFIIGLINELKNLNLPRNFVF